MLRLVNLYKYKLHIFFDFVPQTLADYLNHTGDLTGGLPLKPRHTANLLFQLLDGVSYCHRRGVLHRNLKPKHLLVVAGPDPANPLEGATLKVRAKNRACHHQLMLHTCKKKSLIPLYRSSPILPLCA